MTRYVIAAFVFGVVLSVVIAAGLHWFGWWTASVVTLVVSVVGGWALSRIHRGS